MPCGIDDLIKVLVAKDGSCFHLLLLFSTSSCPQCLALLRQLLTKLLNLAVEVRIIIQSMSNYVTVKHMRNTLAMQIAIEVDCD